MVAGRTSIRTFLVNAKASLQHAIANNSKVTIVVGNESADLDSLTSSLLFSYIRASRPPSQAFTPLYIPLLNIPAADIKLRPEFLKLLPHGNLTAEQLITLDDLPSLDSIEEKLKPENTRWILVDHNVLQGPLGSIYADRVHGVIDHHEDEGKVPRGTAPEPRIIEKTGSCTSLVTEYCCSAWDALSDIDGPSTATNAESDNVAADSASRVWDAQVARLALAAILIDTSNLGDRAKTTEKDVQAVEYLEAKILADRKAVETFDRRRFYEEINAAKQSIDDLELGDILRKDYKMWVEGEQKLGISSVVKPIAFLQEKAMKERSSKDANDSFLAALSEFAVERELDLCCIMTTSSSKEGRFQRELLVWARDQHAVSSLKRLVEDASANLGLEPWEGLAGPLDFESTNECRHVWWQRKVENSRKQFAPLIREAMKSTPSSSL